MTGALTPPVRRFLLSVAVSRFGTGLTLPYTLILLHEVRGIPLPTVGLLLTFPALVGLAFVPLSGALVDRLGPRPVLAGALLLQAAGTLGIAFATRPATALPALLLQGAGLGPSFPAGNALLNGLLDGPATAARAFGLQFTLINAAIGAGTLVGSFVVDVHRPATFVVLYVVAALSAVGQVVLLPAGRHVTDARSEEKGSYREVLGDRTFRLLCLVTLLSAMTGYAALDTGLPAYGRVVAHLAPSTIGLAYTVNTVLIVALQLPVMRWIGHWRRTRALAVAAVLWAASWCLLGLVHTALAALAFAALFGLGEVFQSPAAQPLVNALASDRLRGRYNALSGSMFSIAFVVSPALSGLLIGNGLGQVWIGGLVAGALLTALLLVRLRTALTDLQDGAASPVRPSPL